MPRGNTLSAGACTAGPTLVPAVVVAPHSTRLLQHFTPNPSSCPAQRPQPCSLPSAKASTLNRTRSNLFQSNDAPTTRLPCSPPSCKVSTLNHAAIGEQHWVEFPVSLNAGGVAASKGRYDGAGVEAGMLGIREGAGSPSLCQPPPAAMPRWCSAPAEIPLQPALTWPAHPVGPGRK